MSTQSVEELPIVVTQMDDERAAEMRIANNEATARRLKNVFSEAQKSEATENPEAGCVPWYHFPQAGK